MTAQSAKEMAGCAVYLSKDVDVLDADLAAVERWLKTWDLAIPLRPYSELANTCGTEAERAYTEGVLGDLRQPVYDHRMIFGKPEAVEELTRACDEEKARCDCAEPCALVLLRAIWRVKPLLLALPAEWVQEKVPA